MPCNTCSNTPGQSGFWSVEYFQRLHFWNQWVPLIKMHCRVRYSFDFDLKIHSVICSVSNFMYLLCTFFPVCLFTTLFFRMSFLEFTLAWPFEPHSQLETSYLSKAPSIYLIMGWIYFWCSILLFIPLWFPRNEFWRRGSIVMVELVCCKKRQKKSKPRN